MPDKRESDQQADALNRLYESKSPVLRGRCMRRILDAGSCSDADFVDLVLGLSEPVRLETRAQANAIIRAHPGKVTEAMEAELRKGIAGDQARGTFPRSPFGIG